MSGLEILQYSKRDFEELLKNDEFWTRVRLPITRRRCISQTLNSRAEENDVLLIAAYDKGQLVSYLGILPDLFFAAGEAPVKFGWLTTWWANKTSEHRSVATMMLFMAMKKYSGRIAISSFTPDAKRIYDATRRFHEFARFEPIYFVMALPPKVRILSAPTRLISQVKNRVLFGWKAKRRELETEVVRSFDQSLRSFINGWLNEDPFARDASYWQWVLNHPWVSTAKEDEAAQRRYEFSVFSRCFEQFPMVVRRHGTIIAFLILKLRDGWLSLMYALYDSNDRADVAAALRLMIIHINPSVFVSADDALTAAVRRGIPFYLMALRRDPVLAYASFPLSIGSRPQIGIGDNVFT